MIKIKNIIRAVRRDYHKLEVDPETQLRYHRRMILFWLINFPLISILLFFNVKALYDHSPNGTSRALLLDAITLGINTFYSLYANLDTEMGDAHGAYASMRADQIAQGRSGVTFEPTFANPGYKPLDKHMVAAVMTPNTLDLDDVSDEPITNDTSPAQQPQKVDW